MTRSLRAMARSFADSGSGDVVWSKAQKLIEGITSNPPSIQVLLWLVKSELLIEDGPVATEAETVLRPGVRTLQGTF